MSGSTQKKEAVGQGQVTLAQDAHLLQPLLEHARKTPDKPLFSRRVGAGFESLTAADIVRTVRRLARGLIALGVEPGHRVALMSKTRVEWVLLDYAILATGATTVPIYETSSAEQVEWIISDSGAVMAFFETDTLHGLYRQAADRLPACRHTFVIDQAALEHLQQRGDEVDEARLDERLSGLRTSHLATLIYTSGTTGRPRGCELTHGNIRMNALQVLGFAGNIITPEDRTMLFLPLAHALAKMLFLASVERGNAVAFATSAGKLTEELALVRPTWFGTVPRVLEKVFQTAQQKADQAGRGRVFNLAADAAIRYSREQSAGGVSLVARLQHVVFDRLVYRTLRSVLGGQLRFVVSGGGPLPERLNHFYNGMGVKVLEGYGMTETSPVLTINSDQASRIGTVGQPLPGTTVRLAEDGEILVKGPQIFQGYWHNEEASKRAFTPDGWLQTGDLGSLDEQGFLRITGRKKEILVTAAGKNVAPGPLEDRIREHPLVSQAMVVGEGKPFVAALVTLDPSAFKQWARKNGKEGQPLESLLEDSALRTEVGQAIENANRSVSRAESIRKFAILPEDFTIERNELTPSLKVRRHIVGEHYAQVITQLFERAGGGD
ncbi:long-chain acyl-CoA synthetase [Archangium gephyra]|uniref:Long-chain acyl-CoA synthetase n=1 Tax=Archangium gephyra TaxID=48 RepID=A0AAC8QH80_9BACT|nr:long-chain fatty acid--CoA ligase [Archangium gephyra]AKJ07424.1 Long-chain-fatty-acid--CoA ligase [Archangium gephyra]REG26820.1 long-chain acyl-CoA synthetase [Archangium gephyra]